MEAVNEYDDEDELVSNLEEIKEIAEDFAD
jgi:hypothetical protein